MCKQHVCEAIVSILAVHLFQSITRQRSLLPFLDHTPVAHLMRKRFADAAVVVVYTELTFKQFVFTVY